MRGRHVRSGVLLGVLTLMLSAAAPAASTPARGAGTGTVVAKVLYRNTDGGLQPLAGAEVFLWDNGTPRYGCTNAKGKVTFKNVTSDANLLSATGVGVSDLDCANAEFLNPDNGKKMWFVKWNDHHGEGEFDTFQVGDGEKVTIKYKARTPAKQWKVCAGSMTTIKGTNGDDDLSGTLGADVINALGGDDIVHGGVGGDIICGGDGNDKLWGDAGEDWLLGEGGKDRLNGGPDNDRLDGGPKSDKCLTGETFISCETIL